MDFMDAAHLSLVIIAITVVLFVTEKIPLALTAVLSAVAMGVFKVMPLNQVYVGWGSTTTAMVAGMMVIGDCVFESGLAKVIGGKLIKTKLAQNERVLAFTVTAIGCLVSAFLSNSATIATMMPLIAAVVYKSNGRLHNKYLIMGCGFGCAIGGASTLVGSTAQLIAQGILEKTPGCRPLTMFEFTPPGVILCIILCVYMATIGYEIEKRVMDFPDKSPVAIDPAAWDNDEEEKMTPKMWVSAIVLILCIVGFIFSIWNIAVIAVTGAAVCILFGCKDLHKALRDLDWNTLVILGAAQGFAKGLDVSGGGKLIANFVVNIFGGQNASLVAIFVAGIVVSTVLTNFMSNTAVLAMLTPIFINIGFQLNVHPEVLIIGLILGGSNAIGTPVGTPCVTQTLPAGYRYMDYVKVGAPITIILMIVTCIILPMIYGFQPIN